MFIHIHHQPVQFYLPRIHPEVFHHFRLIASVYHRYRDILRPPESHKRRRSKHACTVFLQTAERKIHFFPLMLHHHFRPSPVCRSIYGRVILRLITVSTFPFRLIEGYARFKAARIGQPFRFPRQCTRNESPGTLIPRYQINNISHVRLFVQFHTQHSISRQPFHLPYLFRPNLIRQIFRERNMKPQAQHRIILPHIVRVCRIQQGRAPVYSIFTSGF